MHLHASINIFLHNTNNRNLLLIQYLKFALAMNNTEERDQILLRRHPLYTPRTEEHELV